MQLHYYNFKTPARRIAIDLDFVTITSWEVRKQSITKGTYRFYIFLKFILLYQPVGPAKISSAENNLYLPVTNIINYKQLITFLELKHADKKNKAVAKKED